MADDWKVKTLGSVLELKRGYDLPKQSRHDGRVPIVSSSGVSGAHATAMVKAPGVVTGRYGTIGQVFYIREDFWPLNTTLYVRDFKGNDPHFVSYLLRRIDFQSCSDKGAVPGVNRNHLHELLVKLPPLPEQKRIAHILGTLDDKIELNCRMNATLEAMAQSLFQSWFVDFDPVRRNAKGDSKRPEDTLFPDSFEGSTIGEIPTGWKAMPLYETATYRNGAPFKPADFCPNGEGLPVVKIAELKSGLSEQTKWSGKQLGSDQMIDTGDLLYSWSGSPDTSLDAFLWSNGPGLVNQHIFKVLTPSDAEKRFVYYLLKHLRPILVETARDKQTTGLGHVTVADMKRLQVCRPPKDVLAAFDRLIGPIFDKAFANTIESQTLAALRDTLLPKLLSGELNANELQFVSS